MKQHPLREFWKTSGWNERETSRPEECLAEGKLAIDVWNSAIKAALSAMMDDEVETLKEAIDNVDFMRYDVKS